MHIFDKTLISVRSLRHIYSFEQAPLKEPSPGILAIYKIASEMKESENNSSLR